MTARFSRKAQGLPDIETVALKLARSGTISAYELSLRAVCAQKTAASTITRMVARGQLRRVSHGTYELVQS